MLIQINNGLDLALSGAAPGGSPLPIKTRRVALPGSDYRHYRLSVSVEEGDRVRAGETVCTLRRYPDIRIAAPASGKVTAIRLDQRRRLESLEIERNESPPLQWEPVPGDALSRMPADAVRQRLLESGLWCGFRARPYERIPAPDIEPRAIFVTAIDTRPLAPDPFLVIEANASSFRDGLTILSRLTSGQVYLCTAEDKEMPLPPCENLHHVRFSGPHPAGLPGTHIHALETIGEIPDLWHIGYQDVVAIGQQFTSGIAPQHRVIAAAGPGMPTSTLQRVCIGAELAEVISGSVQAGKRIFSGSILDGQVQSGFLSRYHNQVTVLQGAGEGSGSSRSRLRSIARMLLQGNTARECDAVHGNRSVRTGMLPLAAFDRVWPYKIPAAALLRALVAGDVETADNLGCRGLAEEDLAICTYMCAAGNDYGKAQRRVLRAIERENL